MEPVEKIIKDCLKSKRKAQKQLYDLFSAKMYGVCMRYASNHHDAQDILQEGFLIVFNKLHTYKHKGSFEGWVRRIMVNVAAQKYREKISHLRVEYLDDEKANLEQAVECEKFEAKELVGMVQTLPAQYRIVFNMYAIEGYSHKEIAETLNVSENTSRSNFFRARNILIEKLQEEDKMAGLYKAVINTK